MPPRATDGVRRQGRMVYVVAAIAFSIQQFDVQLVESDSLPLKFPDRFPVAGLLALVVIALAIPLFVRTIDELVDHYALKISGDVIGNNSISDDEIEELKLSSTSSKSTLLSNFLYYRHSLNIILRWIIFHIEITVPILISIIISIICFESMKDLFTVRSISYYNCGIDEFRMKSIVKKKGTGMSAQADIIFQDLRGNDINMVRYKNPDGNLGGLIPKNLTVPKGMIVPFNSIVCPGAQLESVATIDPATIILSDGTAVPNAPQMLQRPRISNR